MDRVYRENQIDNHTTLVLNPVGDSYKILWRTASRKILRDIAHLTKYDCSRSFFCRRLPTQNEHVEEDLELQGTGVEDVGGNLEKERRDIANGSIPIRRVF